MFHSKDFPQTSVRTDNELIVSEMKKKDGVMDFVLEIKLWKTSLILKNCERKSA